MREALGFLTPLPVRSGPPRGSTLLWFPLVGLLLGVVLGLSWRLLDRVFQSGLLVAALLVVLDLALTGMLHFDGLVDTADGVLPAVGPERRLAIMSDPHVGAYGLAVGVMVLILRVVPLATTFPRPLLLVGLWCLSRTVMAVLAASLQYARDEGGLASAFLDGVPHPAILLGAGCLLAAVPLAGLGTRGPVVLVTALAAGLGTGWWASRRLGGFTGDVLGAAGVVAETAGLLVAVAL